VDTFSTSPSSVNVTKRLRENFLILIVNDNLYISFTSSWRYPAEFSCLPRGISDLFYADSSNLVTNL